MKSEGQAATKRSPIPAMVIQEERSPQLQKVSKPGGSR
jgi:hypothetical protein